MNKQWQHFHPFSSYSDGQVNIACRVLKYWGELIVMGTRFFLTGKEVHNLLRGFRKGLHLSGHSILR